jgi:hypothetical protein
MMTSPPTLGDSLQFNDVGYQAMAESIDLALFHPD